MPLKLLLTCLLVSLATAVPRTHAAGEHKSTMEHVLVSVPIHKTAAETAMPVTVLSGDALRRQAAATIGDTLSNSPGLANASFGPGVGQPVIRGQAGPRVTVLQNGTSSADASNISADHATSVEALLAQSIEVLRGPATLLYGGGAIGGVVNVVDNRIPPSAEGVLGGGVEYRHDSASDGDTLVAKLNGGNGVFAWHLDGLSRDWDDIEIPGSAAKKHDGGSDEETTEGFVANSDGRTKSATLGGSYHFDDGFLGLAVNRLENNYGIPPGAHGHHEESEEFENEEEEEVIRLDVEQTRYDAALHIHEPFSGLDVFRGFLTYTDYGHVELEGQEIGTRYSNETWETRLEMVHSPWGKFHGSFGLQARSGEFSALGEEAFVPVTDSSQFGLFLIEDYHSERWTLEGGLRMDYVERDPESRFTDKVTFNAFSLSGSLLYEISDQWQLGLALMRAERAPATEELYSNVESDNPADWVVHAATSTIELGDPDLDIETSNNGDLSLSWVTDKHRLSLTTFYNAFSDYIGLTSTGLAVDETAVLAYRNEDTNFYGLEFDSEVQIAELGTGTVKLGIKGDFIRGELDSGEDVPRLPPRRLGARLAWDNTSWNVHAAVLDAADQDRPGANEEKTDGYTRWDAGVEWRTGLSTRVEMVLFMNLKNLTDEEIRLSTSFLRDFAPEPGRSIEGGFRLTF